MRAPAVDVRGVLAFHQLANSCLFRVGPGHGTCTAPAASGSYHVAIRSVCREGAVGLAKPSMSASQKSGISRLSKDHLRSQQRTSLFPCTVHLRYGLQHSAFVQYADHYQLKRASPLHAQPRLTLLSCPDHWRTKYRSRRHNA